MDATAVDPQPTSPIQPNHVGSLPRTVRVDLRLAVRLGVVFTLTAGLFLAWLGNAYYRIEADNEQALVRANNERVLRLSALAMTESLAEVMADLRFLGHSNELDAYLSSGGRAAARGLEREYAALITQKRSYDQARFIDLDGWERIRVNHAPDGARIIPADQLQAKASRYYFAALTTLHADEIYVSPMDLNVEREQLERPAKPMIRFGIAIYDRQGTRRGYVVINYLAERLLNKLRNLSGNGQPLWLLDAHGEWLLGPGSDNTWSGQLPERRQRGFARQHPAAWEAMRQQATGTLSVDASNLQFLRIYPLYSLADTGDLALLAQPVAAESYFWYALIANQPKETAAGNARLSPMAVKAGMVMALLLLVVAAASALAYAIARQRALAQTLEQAVDNVPVLIAYVDAGQRFRFNNRAYIDSYGITPKELYGQHLRDILGEDAYEKARPHLEQALAGRRVAFELHLDSGPGPHDQAVAYLPDLTVHGQVRGFYAVVNDITLLKEIQRRERQHLLELAYVSRLASVGELATEIAHQINQPLAAIGMFSSAAQRVMENGGNPQQVRDCLGMISTQVKRAAEVIDHMRRFVRKGETQWIELDLNEPARAVATLLEYEAKARQVALTLELGDNLPAVRVDAILMEQVIYNLARNAIEALAGRDQERRVAIRTRADSDRVWVEVMDNGPGVDLEQGEHIFEPFSTQKQNGLGMGLAISRSIVTALGGVIGYTNLPEGGAMFFFHVPRVKP